MTRRLLSEGRRLGAALLLALLALWLWAAAANAATPQGELVLVLERWGGYSDAKRLAGGLRGRVVASIPQLDAYLVDLPGTARPEATLLDTLGADPDVERAEPVRELNLIGPSRRALTADDPAIASAWHLATIGADTAWQTTMGSPGVVIAVVDTGVDYTHPDLAGKVVLGPDFGSGDSNPLDTHGHGTHVAGIAAATANNGIGAAGVCPSCTILAVKVFADGSGSTTSFTTAQGITWAADNGADVVNLSLGSASPSSVLRDAVDYAWSKGVVVVAAAGNSATSYQHYPAAYTNAIAVGSTTSSDTLSSFSNHGSWVDLTAPGSGIYSTVTGGGYASWSGTSMASPVVAGAAGLAFSGLPSPTAQSVRAALEAAVADLGAPGKDSTFGFGRIDVARLFGGSGGGLGGGGTPPAITTASLPGGTVGSPYSASLAASGGTPPYSWSLSAGSLPTGLSLSPAGAIGGTPAQAGTASFTVRVTDAAGQTATRSLSIAVAAATPTLPDLTGSWLRAERGFGKVAGDFQLSVTGATATGVVVRFQLVRSGLVLSQRDVSLGTVTPGARLVRVELTGFWSGSLVLRAIADPAGAMAESNELNNRIDTAVP